MLARPIVVGAHARPRTRPTRDIDHRPAERSALRGATDAAAGELRLLIVDDDPLMTELLPRRLSRGIAAPRLVVSVARTPEDGMRLVRVERPDVILCDYNLRAAQTGLDVLSDAKIVCPRSFRILFSAHARHEIQRFETAPIDAFIEKPMNLRELVPAFAGALRTGLGLAVVEST